MLNRRILLLALLAVPACTVPYPYSPYSNHGQNSSWSEGSTWAPSSQSATTTTFQNGTTVVVTLDPAALERLTAEANANGSNVLHVHIGEQGWDRGTTASFETNTPVYDNGYDENDSGWTTNTGSAVSTSTEADAHTPGWDKVDVVSPQPIASPDTVPAPNTGSYGWGTQQVNTPSYAPVQQTAPATPAATSTPQKATNYWGAGAIKGKGN